MLLSYDSVTWIAVGLALAAVVIAVTFAVVVLLALRRRPDAAGPLQEHPAASDLARALQDAREETTRAQELADIGASVDLDAVLNRALESAGRLPDVDAAMVVLPEGSGAGDSEPLVATTGMSSEEAVRHPLSGPSGQSARAVRIAYSYTREEAEEDGELIRGGVSVPLRGEEGDPIGTLAVFWRGREREATDEELARLEKLAARAGPAIDNARRFREARQLADLDALTGLHNRRYFHETLARECSRAHRYDRQLALVVLDVDDFKSINDRVGHLAGDGVLAAVAERVQSVVRSADVACRVGGDEFAVILPESTLADAEQLYRRVQLAVGSRPLGPFERIHLSAGLAELQPQDDAKSLFERTDEALYRAKETGKGRFSAANGVG